MIHDEICTYEVCMLAKEKGFPTDEIKSWYYEYDGCPTKEIIDKHQYPNITQSLLQRWLREEKKYAISVFWDMLSKTYCYEIVKTIGVLEIQVGEKYNYSNPKGFGTYEFALEDALKYVLENLI